MSLNVSPQAAKEGDIWYKVRQTFLEGNPQYIETEVDGLKTILKQDNHVYLGEEDNTQFFTEVSLPYL